MPSLSVPTSLEIFSWDLVGDNPYTRSTFTVRVLEKGTYRDWLQLPADWTKVEMLRDYGLPESVDFWLALHQHPDIYGLSEDAAFPPAGESALAPNEIEEFLNPNGDFTEAVAWGGMNALFSEDIPNPRGRFEPYLYFYPLENHSFQALRAKLIESGKVTALGEENEKLMFETASGRMILIQVLSSTCLDPQRSSLNPRGFRMKPEDVVAAKLDSFCSKPSITDLIDLFLINEHLPISWKEIFSKASTYNPILLNKALRLLTDQLIQKAPEPVPLQDPPTVNELLIWVGQLYEANFTAAAAVLPLFKPPVPEYKTVFHIRPPNKPIS